MVNNSVYIAVRLRQLTWLGCLLQYVAYRAKKVLPSELAQPWHLETTGEDDEPLTKGVNDSAYQTFLLQWHH